MMNRAAVTIPEKLFFKIGEVCDIVGIQAHVLRYWESEFPMLAPQKNRAGQRTYRKRDVEMVLRIRELLYEEQYTIPGARKRLSSDLRGASKLKVVTPDMTPNVAPPASEPQPYAAPSHAFAPTPQSAQDDSARSNATGNATGAGVTNEQRQAVRQLRAQLHELLAMLDDEQT